MIVKDKLYIKRTGNVEIVMDLHIKPSFLTDTVVSFPSHCTTLNKEHLNKAHLFQSCAMYVFSTNEDTFG